MKSKPLGFDFLSPRRQHRLKSDAEFATTDRLARMEYNQTEIVELHRLARSDSATLARANREMMEGSFEQLGDDLRAGLGEISASLQGMENSLGQLNETANAQLSVLENIADMLFHIATGRDYNATLRQRTADAQEAQRQQQIARDYVEALDLLRAALTEPNASKRKMQMEQVEYFLRLAMTLPSVSAQAAMELGTFLLARDGNLDGAKECYEHSLCRIRSCSRIAVTLVLSSRAAAPHP